jgi:hypothetical protein
MRRAWSVEGRIPRSIAVDFLDAPLDVFGMDVSHSPHESLGFLAVRQRDPHGFFGGYLLVNHRARPLEFHCTLPVQPTRAQQILYGATLVETICGELIARALLEKGAQRPRLVMTDCRGVLAARHWADLPMIHLESATPAMDSIDEFTIPSVSHPESRYASRIVWGMTFSCISSYSRDLDALQEIEAFQDQMDFTEPFSRIVEALAEAHPRSRAA